MRVLFLSPRQAWPVNSGAKLREYYLARGLAQHVHVTLLAFAEEKMRSALPFLAEVLTVERPQRYTPLKLLRGFFGPEPLSLLNYRTPAMQQALAELLARTRFDIIQVEGTPMAAYRSLFENSGARIVYDWHNIESELLQRYAASSSWPRSLYATITARKLERVEREMLASGAAHIVCSERERVQLKSLAPQPEVYTVPNGVDVAYFQTAHAAATATPYRVLFVGSMDYHANVEAAVEFAHQIWPYLQGAYPHLRLTLLGANPAPQVRNLANLPGIEVTGTVPDLRPYYSEALVSVVPLRTGGGTRLKILEAFAAGVPVVSTAVGAEGLDVVEGTHFLLASSPEEWVEAVRRLVEHPDVTRQLVQHAHDLVTRVYDWSSMSDQLLKIYEHLLSPSAPLQALKHT
jgi:sugar transferase (PEP-CTERM/EpsH1 system associated)